MLMILHPEELIQRPSVMSASHKIVTEEIIKDKRKITTKSKSEKGTSSAITQFKLDVNAR